MSLNSAKVESERARYRILTPAPKGFFGPDDHLYMEGEEIYFDGTPNEEMEPLNELAETRLTEYLEELDRLGRATAEKLGRPFTGRARTLDGALQIATEVQRSGIAIMGVKREVSSIERAERDKTPETGSSNPKSNRGRPKTVKEKIPSPS